MGLSRCFMIYLRAEEMKITIYETGFGNYADKCIAQIIFINWDEELNCTKFGKRVL